MKRNLMSRGAAALLLLVVAAPVARAQDFQARISRALRILSEMEALLDGIRARAAAPRSQPAPSADWRPLFNGSDLSGWKQSSFSGGADVKAVNPFRGGPGAITVDSGLMLSGVTYTGDVPRTNYEIALEFMKLEGSDFACGLTFPVGDSHASLIVGGWGGGVVGISSIDDRDASENDTTKYLSFARNQWYRVRLRVTPGKLEAWLDDKQIIDQDIAGKKISLRPGEISNSRPLGLATYQTAAAYRNIRLRTLTTGG